MALRPRSRCTMRHDHHCTSTLKLRYIKENCKQVVRAARCYASTLRFITQIKSPETVSDFKAILS